MKKFERKSKLKNYWDLQQDKKKHQVINENRKRKTGKNFLRHNRIFFFQASIELFDHHKKDSLATLVES